MNFLISFAISSLVFLTSLSQASSLIIDGRDLKTHEYPAVHSIEIFIGNEMSMCTATFISDNTLLTAAHCVFRFLEARQQNIDADIVLPGQFRLKKILIHNAYKRIKYEEQKGLGGYDYLKMANDIALIVMEGDHSKTHMNYSTKPKTGKASMVGFGGKTLLTVAQMNQHMDETIGYKRVGSLYIEEINALGRIDSEVRVFNSRNWYNFIDQYSATYGEKTSVTSRGDSGGPLIQNGKIIGVIAGTDATQQNQTTVYSIVNYFAGLHSGIFADLREEAKTFGSSIR